MEYIALFFTHSGAIKYNKFLTESNIKCVTMPVPRKLSSSCGVGVRFTYTGPLESIITDDIKKIFSIDGNTYIIKYEFE